MKSLLKYLTVIAITAFALLTLFVSGSVIFDLFGFRAKEGNYVLFVVWANFICGLLYLAAAYGFIKNKLWSLHILGICVILLITAFICFIIYISSGGIYETKTIGALIFRITASLVFTVAAYFLIPGREK